MLSRKTFLLAGAVLLIGAGVGAYFLHGPAPGHAAEPTSDAAKPTAAPPVPVTAAQAHKGDVPIVLEGLGTVTPINTATMTFTAARPGRAAIPCGERIDMDLKLGAASLLFK